MLGGLDISNLSDDQWVRRDISKVDIHPEWNPATVKYDADIAVLTMSQAVQLSDYIQIVCLPSKNEQVSDVDGSVVGHGVDGNNIRLQDIPKTLQVSSITNEDCFLIDHELGQFSSRRTFCAGSLNNVPCKSNFNLTSLEKYQIYFKVKVTLEVDFLLKKMALGKSLELYLLL